MAGTAQANRTGRDASGGPSGCRLRLISLYVLPIRPDYPQAYPQPQIGLSTGVATGHLSLAEGGDATAHRTELHGRTLGRDRLAAGFAVAIGTLTARRFPPPWSVEETAARLARRMSPAPC
jgi:hypothetical protein